MLQPVPLLVAMVKDFSGSSLIAHQNKKIEIIKKFIKIFIINLNIIYIHEFEKLTNSNLE